MRQPWTPVGGVIESNDKPAGLEPVCDELLILGKSVIRHTHGQSRKAGPVLSCGESSTPVARQPAAPTSALAWPLVAVLASRASATLFHGAPPAPFAEHSVLESEK